MSHSTSTARVRISSSRPQDRNNSMDRVLTTVAFGSPDRTALRSTTSDSTP